MIELDIKNRILTIITALKELNKQLPTRGVSIAITKLEEALFWLTQEEGK